MQRGPIGPLCMSAAKIVQQLTDGNFASVWINSLDGGLAVCVRGGEFPGTCGLRQSITLAIHRQDVDVARFLPLSAEDSARIKRASSAAK